MSRRYIDENGYMRGKVSHSDLIHRQVAYREIYLKNKDKYDLPFSEYQVHHKDGDPLNNRVSNLQIVTPEEHERIHGIGRGRGMHPLAVFMIIIVVTLGLVGFSTWALQFYHFSKTDSSSQTIVEPVEQKPFFDFQAVHKSDEEISSEISQKIGEYASTHQGIASCNVFKIAEAWGVSRPEKGPGRACSYTMNIPGYNDEYSVKAVFQADCLGCRNKHGYTVDVVR